MPKKGSRISKKIDEGIWIAQQKGLQGNIVISKEGRTGQCKKSRTTTKEKDKASNRKEHERKKRQKKSNLRCINMC
jgi:hypothetical protein